MLVNQKETGEASRLVSVSLSSPHTKCVCESYIPLFAIQIKDELALCKRVCKLARCLGILCCNHQPVLAFISISPCRCRKGCEGPPQLWHISTGSWCSYEHEMLSEVYLKESRLVAAATNNRFMQQWTKMCVAEAPFYRTVVKLAD